MTENLHKVQGILTHLLLTNSQCDQSSTLHGLGTKKAVLLTLFLLENIEQKRHQSSIILIEGGLGGISNSGNSGQGLLLQITLRAAQEIQEMAEKVSEVWLQGAALRLLAEIDKSSGSVGLHTRLGRGKNGNNVSEDNLVILLLHGTGKVGTHLTKSIAACIPDSGVRVLEGRDNKC